MVLVLCKFKKLTTMNSIVCDLKSSKRMNFISWKFKQAKKHELNLTTKKSLFMLESFFLSKGTLQCSTLIIMKIKNAIFSRRVLFVGKNSSKNGKTGSC